MIIYALECLKPGSLSIYIMTLWKMIIRTTLYHAAAPFLVAMSRVDPKRFGIEFVRFISLVDNLKETQIQLLKTTQWDQLSCPKRIDKQNLFGNLGRFQFFVSTLLSSPTLSTGSLWVVAWKRCCASSAVAAEAPGHGLHGLHGQHGQHLPQVLSTCCLVNLCLVLPPKNTRQFVLNKRDLKKIPIVSKPWKPAPDVSAQKDGQFTIHCMALSSLASPPLSSKSQTVINSFADNGHNRDIVVVVVILWPEPRLHLSDHAC